VIACSIRSGASGEVAIDVGNVNLGHRGAVGLIKQALDDFEAAQRPVLRTAVPQPATEPPVPFPVEALPPAMRGFVLDVSRVHRTPPDLPACYALGIVSASMGKGLRMRTEPDRTTSGNLYLIVGALSGAGKSSVFESVMAPLRAYENQLADKWGEDQGSRRAVEEELRAAKIKKIKEKVLDGSDKKKQAASQEQLIQLIAQQQDNDISEPSLICEDITSEAMAEHLAQNGECIALFSGDGRAVVDIICGRYRRANAKLMRDFC
jgi:hypothetical protein